MLIFLGPEITPRRRASVLTLRTIPGRPFTFRQIEALFGVPRSTASDICRHALTNVIEKREEERKRANEPDESEDNGNKEIELKDLIASDCLDPKPRPGGPQKLSEAEKAHLAATVPTGI